MRVFYAEISAATAATCLPTTLKCLSFEIGAVSLRKTTSPIAHVFPASCAFRRLVRKRYLPYLGCLMYLSTSTTTVSFIAVETTLPVTSRSFFCVCCSMIIFVFQIVACQQVSSRFGRFRGGAFFLLLYCVFFHQRHRIGSSIVAVVFPRAIVPIPFRSSVLICLRRSCQ